MRVREKHNLVKIKHHANNSIWVIGIDTVSVRQRKMCLLSHSGEKGPKEFVRDAKIDSRWLLNIWAAVGI